ncbi:HlyD family efflux transporter periplasmic adaptor subunit [Panacibacter ginsenosidivorans]|uniref:HlyD family efflux transporter periplasmic adaptor subunit n=1 Tax=Panacibacter ginsenosidivorans TaxID=1813871 RepID=A0A5B8VBX8_9BACT|nr:HlyD family efflux transporter periplasmic adaptor subunit [Panacibacter ginsenosidivorans]QEC68934.1 HlyD family efflux transporter periplasmic adaptor subunit [Panacibacter ginsenosidivorans]
MDISIETQVSGKKRKKAVTIIVVIAIAIIALILLLRSTLQSSITKKEFTTAVVEMGSIENTVNASGEVLPEFEEIITSPINASIKNVVMDAGTNVKAGESILTLDKSATQTELEKLKFELEVKRNNIHKLKLELDKSFYDIKSNNDIKQLRINSLEADVENAKRLYKAGGGTQEDIEKAELDLKVAKLEKQQLENEIKSKQQTMQVEMRESEIDAAIKENDLKELQRKLDLANIVTSRAGVITWINKNIGASVTEGEALARIADLSGFKVSGSVSDNFMSDLHIGMAAIIRVGESQMRGTVSNIYPSVQNNIVTFDIRLDEQNNKLLRPNLKVDVYLVTAAKNNIMRVTNGPGFQGASSQNIFVVHDGKAERRSVHIGMTNFDFVEIKDNVKPGDVIITSDMSKFKNVREITIRN